MRVTEAIGFDGGRNPFGLMAVANSITNVVDELIPGNPPFGSRSIQLIRVEGDGSSARVLWSEQDFNSTTYRIHLKTQTTKWQQMAFQLSHELAHVKMGPARSNLLVEVFAHALSLESLGLLQTKWKIQPPFSWDGWAEYADSIVQYQQETVQTAAHCLPVDIRGDFSEQPLEDQMQRLNDSKSHVENLALCHPESRGWQIVAADILTHHILNTHERWEELLSLAIHTDPSAMVDRSYRHDLKVRNERLPTWVPEFLK